MFFRYIVEWTDRSMGATALDDWKTWSNLNKDKGQFFDIDDARVAIIDQYRNVSSKVKLDDKDQFLYHRVDANGRKDGCIIRIRGLVPETNWQVGIADLLLNK